MVLKVGYFNFNSVPVFQRRELFKKKKMSAENIPYWFVLILSGFATFFIIRFYYMVDEIRRDVKQMLTEMAENRVTIDRLKNDVDELAAEIREHRDRITEIEKNIYKSKPQR